MTISPPRSAAPASRIIPNLRPEIEWSILPELIQTTWPRRTGNHQLSDIMAERAKAKYLSSEPVASSFSTAAE